MLAPKIGGYDRNPDPYFADGERGVNISDKALKSVAFIGIRKDGKFLPRATCFFVNYIEDQRSFDHIVTAEHVVSSLITAGHDIWLRVNLVNGTTHEFSLNHDEFYFHPDNEREPTDVAVCPLRTLYIEEGEAKAFDVASLRLLGENSFYPTAQFAAQYMGRGGEIAIIGLFRSHYGTNKNIPIVRVGNISALPEEPVWTKYAGYIKAYLVEARSISGLSGSPVFAFPDNALELSKALTGDRHRRVYGIALLGLMHGHFDVPHLNEDVVSDEDEPPRGVHTGIGVVIPVEKILETIRHPELVAMRKSIVKGLRESGGAIADLATDVHDDVPPSTDENPKHREDFMRLASAAARKQKQDE
jgi:hypothetical protein